MHVLFFPRFQRLGLLSLLLILFAVLGFRFEYVFSTASNNLSTQVHNSIPPPLPYKPKAKTTPTLIELNKADSLDLMSIKGIGPSFARRIEKYRSLLGGFYTKEQLQEVYGLEHVDLTDIYKQIYVDYSLIVPLNINTASYSELLKHPYLEHAQAANIVRSRANAKIDSWEMLLKLESFSMEDERLKLYICF